MLFSQGYNRAAVSVRPASRRGFTLVELLVVIAIIGVLVALLLPAVQAAREAARRTQCQNNIRQYALGLQNYHSARNTFPAASNFDVKFTGALPGASKHVGSKPNWVVNILPYIEQQALYDAFDFNFPISGIDPENDVNREARGAVVASMICPSDVGHDTPFNDSQLGDNWARGNYGANAGLGGFQVAIGSETEKDPVGYRAAASADSPQWVWNLTGGVMGGNTARSIGQIEDGTSNTILLGELRVGLDEIDPRGTWALGIPGASAMWMHGSDNALGPNDCQDGGDSIRNGTKIVAAVGEDTIRAECMHCDGAGGGNQAAPRSQHPGGVHVAMCDGSVQFILNEVESSSAWGIEGIQEMLVWQRLNAASDGLVVNLGEL